MRKTRLSPIPMSWAIDYVIKGEGYIKNYSRGTYVFFHIAKGRACEVYKDDGINVDNWRQYIKWLHIDEWEADT